MTADRPVTPDTPAARFWAVTVCGTNTVWLAHVDRASRADAQREYDYWRGLLGPLVTLEILDGGAEVMVAHMAIAIQTLSKDGSGVTPARIVAYGFAPDAVARHFTAAAQLVAASLPQEEEEHAPASRPDNVVRLIPRSRRG
jgi:hypothetical protein